MGILNSRCSDQLIFDGAVVWGMDKENKDGKGMYYRLITVERDQ